VGLVVARLGRGSRVGREGRDGKGEVRYCIVSYCDGKYMGSLGWVWSPQVPRCGGDETHELGIDRDYTYPAYLGTLPMG